MASPSEIKTLDVILTAGCNLRCSYCYQNDKKARRMEWDTLRASLDLLLRSSQPEVRLLFVGGEPLLEFPLIQQAVAYVEEVRPATMRVQYDMVTNGTLLREEQAAFLAEHDFEVRLSFDGVPAAQDLRGKGTFEPLDRLLDRLRRERRGFFEANLSVGLTLLPRTIPYLADSIDYFLAKGVQEIAVTPAITYEPDWRLDRIDELEAQVARVFRSCRRHYRRTAEVPFLLFRKSADDPCRPDRISMCGVGRGEVLAVDVDGQVHGCVTFAGSYQTFPTTFLRSRLDAMRMGDVRHPELVDRMAAYPAAARAAGLFYDKQDKYSSYGRCGECRFLGVCAVCPVSIGHQPGNTDPDRVPDFACAYNLVSLKYRERFPAPAGIEDILLGRPHVPELMRELEAFAGRRRNTRRRRSSRRPRLRVRSGGRAGRAAR